MYITTSEKICYHIPREGWLIKEKGKMQVMNDGDFAAAYEPVSAPSIETQGVEQVLINGIEKMISLLEETPTLKSHHAITIGQEAIDKFKKIKTQPQSEGGLQWVKGRYDELYRQVKSGKETVCFVDYQTGIEGRVMRDICTVRNRHPYLQLSARGICYGDCDHPAYSGYEDQRFDQMCTLLNVEWLDESASPSTANTAVLALQSILRNIDNQHWNCKDFREEVKSIAEQGLRAANTEEGAEARLPVILLTEDQMFRIAKIIDKNFIGTEKTFTAVRKEGYWILSTNKCDFASEIKIFGTHESLQRIERLGEDTEGWQPIREFTMKRVLELYELFLTES